MERRPCRESGSCFRSRGEEGPAAAPPSLFKKSANAVKETIASQHDEYKNSTYKIPPNESNIGLIDVHPGISKKHITKKE